MPYRVLIAVDDMKSMSIRFSVSIIPSCTIWLSDAAFTAKKSVVILYIDNFGASTALMLSLLNI